MTEWMPSWNIYTWLPQSSCLTNVTKPQMSFRKLVRLTTWTFLADGVHLARNKMVHPSLYYVLSNHIQNSSLTIQQRQLVGRKLSSVGRGGRNPAPAWGYTSNKSQTVIQLHVIKEVRAKGLSWVKPFSDLSVAPHSTDLTEGVF